MLNTLALHSLMSCMSSPECEVPAWTSAVPEFWSSVKHLRHYFLYGRTEWNIVRKMIRHDF